MPSVLVETVGSATANTYVTRAQATTYHGDRLNTAAWTSASDAEKDQALLQSARRLSDESFLGTISSVTQSLPWPRYGCYDRNGVYIDGDEIPQLVKDAQCELALAYLVAEDAGSDVDADTGLEGFLSTGVGPLSATPNLTHRAGTLPVKVKRLLEPVLASASNTATLRRG